MDAREMEMWTQVFYSVVHRTGDAINAATEATVAVKAFRDAQEELGNYKS